MTAIRLLTRGDDFGSFRTANRAILDCVNQGILCNVSVMVVTGFWEEAVDMFHGRDDVCLGLHLTINAEWGRLRWRPLLPAARVPSLVCADGGLPTRTHDLDGRAEPLEIVAECRAQLDLARSRGLAISYLDEHCGFGWLCEGEVRQRLRELAAAEGLVFHADCGLQPMPRPAGAGVDDWLRVLRGLEPGLAYRWVGHPCYPDVELENLVNRAAGDREPANVAAERDAQRLMFMHPSIVAGCEELDIELVRYTQLS